MSDEQKQKISDWLSRLSSHDIYDHKALCESFVEKTGQAPQWPSYSRAATRQAIKNRGLGGELRDGAASDEMAYGYVVAESLADHYAPGVNDCTAMGRGTRFRAAVGALRKAGK